MMSVAQWERRVIGQRTREALAVKRLQGVKLGRPRAMPGDVRRRILLERDQGFTLRAIADRLNHEGVPTAQGGRCWHATTIRKVVGGA